MIVIISNLIYTIYKKGGEATMMDYRLQVFIAVVEHRNFSKAAKELHMTQPAVSQYIRALEDDFGTRLLERTNKYVRLNKAGEMIYYHAKEIIGSYVKMNHLVDDLLNEAKGPLTIGASYTFGEYVLPPMIAKLKENYPDIKPILTIDNTKIIANLTDTHQLDIGIVEGNFVNKDLYVKELTDDRMYVVSSPFHPLFEKEAITLTDLQDETWILREPGSGTREATEELFQQLNLSPSNVITFGSTQSIKGAIEAGLGISLLSQWAIQKELQSEELVILPYEKLTYKRNFSLIKKSSFQTKALQVFLALLEEESIFPKHLFTKK